VCDLETSRIGAPYIYIYIYIYIYDISSLRVKLYCYWDNIVHVCNQSLHVNSLISSCVVFKTFIFASRQFYY